MPDDAAPVDIAHVNDCPDDCLTLQQQLPIVHDRTIKSHPKGWRDTQIQGFGKNRMRVPATSRFVLGDPSRVVDLCHHNITRDRHVYRSEHRHANDVVKRMLPASGALLMLEVPVPPSLHTRVLQPGNSSRGPSTSPQVGASAATS